MKNGSVHQIQKICDKENISEILQQVGSTIEDPEFYPAVFGAVAKKIEQRTTKNYSKIKRICSEEYDHLSRHLEASQVQEGCAVRNVLFARSLASALIDEEGELDKSALDEAVAQLRNHLYSLGPERYHDSKRHEAALKVLTALKQSEELAKRLCSIRKPDFHRHAIALIRDTLHLSESAPLTDTHARRAVLAAWICYLRQSVGSCFGTAPAIIVHEEQFEVFFKDIQEIFDTGRLKRIIGGAEYSVPLSPSWGSGDLKRRLAVSRELSEDGPRLWWSPGLLAALKAVGMLDEKDPLAEKRMIMKRWIENALQDWKEPGKTLVVTCEQLLRKILLKKNKLTESDIADYRKRSGGGPFGGMAQEFQAKAHDWSQGAATARFLSEFLTAKRAFCLLADNALLKAWEFSIASFAETKASFTRWNLYSSLGLAPEDAGGIGGVLYQTVQNRLQILNRQVEEYQSEYEYAYGQLKFAEGRLKRAATEEEAKWLKAEYQTRSSEFRLLEEMRDRTHDKARRTASLFQMLVERYYELFPQYFQEVYDADMHLDSGQYDDSPAGFRLMYKHGRSNTSLWTFIFHPQDYIEHLANFFVATENELLNDSDFKGLEEEVSDIITNIISHVRTEEFLESSFYRMAQAHNQIPIKSPLDNLDKIEKKPWAYTSGGNVETLLGGYFARDAQPTVMERWVESPIELLVFMIDTFRGLPYKELEKYALEEKRSYLMHSPTHVFVAKPDLSWFRKGWETEAYTYTWVRDSYISPIQNFLSNIRLDSQMMQWVVQQIVLENMPADFRPRFQQIFRTFPRDMRPAEFRDYVLGSTASDSGIPPQYRLREEMVDSFLYSHLPLFSSYELKDKLFHVFSMISELERVRDEIMKLYDEFVPKSRMSEVMSAKTLEAACKAVLLLFLQKTSLPFDLSKKIRRAMRALKYAYPETFIVADTNWEKGMFGFVVNPGSTELELWHVDDLGSEGFPMTVWKQWLDGSRRDIPWGLYTRPYEYTGVY